MKCALEIRFSGPGSRKTSSIVWGDVWQIEAGFVNQESEADSFLKLPDNKVMRSSVRSARESRGAGRLHDKI